MNLDTHCLRNKDLKWDAKGLHAYLCQLPLDWQINIADLSNRSLNGREGTSNPMRALCMAGYVVRERKHDANGRFEGYDYQVFERPEYAKEWLEAKGMTVNAKAVNGETVNGLTVNGETATTKYDTLTELSKNEEREHAHAENKFSSFKEDALGNGKVAPAAENSAAAPTHHVTTTDPSDPRVKVVTPFTMPKMVETVDEAEAKIMEWAQGEGRESVKYWYELAGRKCTLGDVTAMVSKFAGVYLTIGDESKRLRMAQDPLQFFKYTFKGFLKNEKSFAANTTATNGNGYNSNNTQSVLPKALQNQVGK